MLTRVLLIGLISVTTLSARPDKRMMIAEAKTQAAKHFGREISKKRVIFGKDGEGYVVTFLPRDTTTIGNGAICYFTKDGKFVRIEFMQ
jgi:hypothetical protein